MPVTPNTLLQASAQAKTQPAANPPVAAPELGNKASNFAQVFAQQTSVKSSADYDAPAKSVRDKAGESTFKKDAGGEPAAAAQPAVADSGKPLPAEKPASADDKTADDDSAETTDTPVADAPPVDPTLDPALDPALLPDMVATATTAEVEPAPAVVTPQSPAAPLTASTQAATPAVDPAFDPATDPLDALPTLRLAMEQGGHVSAASQVQPKATAPASVDGDQTSAQNFAAGMANMLSVQADQDSTGAGSQGGDKAFSGIISDGLKDLNAASSDTRVDDFANRLAALTQAATPKTANAVPVNQPIAMNQSGWTEEVVNRVMYLSSANLKAADIQLQPAELGRLDIRVNMAPDQQTQVSFMSAHAGVREALEGQMHRLRDSFTQQGMGQVDVSVSDQSRGSQSQEQQAQRQAQPGRDTTSGSRVDSVEENLPTSVAEVTANIPSVVGSSAVDYYA